MAAAARGRRVALATYAAAPELSDDDRPIVPALAAHGVDSEPVAWDNANIDWSRYAAVVVRSCWNYHHHPAAFSAWIAQVERAGVPLWNAPATLRWNLEKTYLRDLAARGIPVVPTRWIERGEAVSLCSIRSETGWHDIVIKPAISASAHQTWRASDANASDATDASDAELRLQAMTARGRVLVQPFLPAIETDGEWSIVFLGGVFSHGVRKTPRRGDFRVQAEHGGLSVASAPDGALVKQALAVLRAAPYDTATSLYARVDCCMSDARFVLMELELLEPTLYLTLDAAAPARFAEALVSRLASGIAEVRSDSFLAG